MAESTIKAQEEKMVKAIETTKERLTAIRAGKANVNMLDNILVNSYGSPAPIRQVANLSAPEAKLIVIEPWDKSMIKEIEKSIIQSNMGFNPNNDGKVIRIMLPDLTTERRKEYVKIAKKEIEEGKIAIRNIRKDANNALRKLEKDSLITEDELKVHETSVQTLTDKYIKDLDEIYAAKEKEITTI